MQTSVLASARERSRADVFGALLRHLHDMNFSYDLVPRKKGGVWNNRLPTVRVTSLAADKTRLLSLFTLLHHEGYQVYEHIQTSAERHVFTLLSLRTEMIHALVLDLRFVQPSYGRRSLRQLSGFLTRQLCRALRSVWRPSGVMIALLGPDGSGKSTMAECLLRALEPLFARQRLYHWRPGILGSGRSGDTVTDPHGLLPRGRITSTIYLLSFYLDNVVGFVFQIWPLLVRHGLVVFDRCFSDVLVDPIRYRYDGSLWMAQLLNRLIPPQEKLVLILDAAEARIFSRKSELSIDELRRQRDAYLTLAPNLAGQIRVLATDGTIEAVKSRVLQIVLGYLTDKFREEHASCTTCSALNVVPNAIA